MNNITILNEDYGKITGIGVKKIKLSEMKLANVKAAAIIEQPVFEEPKFEERVFEPVMEPQVNVVPEPSVEAKPEPVFYNGPVNPGYGIDDVLSQRAKKVEESYRREEPKIEIKKEVEPVKPSSITDKEFKALLETEISNSEIKEEIKKYSHVFAQKLAKIENLKAKQAKYADAFQKVSSEEQTRKAYKEFLDNRVKEMRNMNNFAYLEVHQNETPEILEIMEILNKDLTNLINTVNGTRESEQAGISKCANDKIVIEKESSKVREGIKNENDSLNEFMLESVEPVRELIEADKIFNKSKVAGQKVIKSEYNDFSNTEDLGEVRHTISASDANGVPRINVANEPKEDLKSVNPFGPLRENVVSEPVNMGFVNSAERKQVTEIYNSNDFQNEQVSYFGRVA